MRIQVITFVFLCSQINAAHIFSSNLPFSHSHQICAPCDPDISHFPSLRDLGEDVLLLLGATEKPIVT